MVVSLGGCESSGLSKHFLLYQWTVILRRTLTAMPYSICDFKFVFGLVVLMVILSNADSLSKYLQGKKTADATMETLSKCWNEESFQMVWSRAEIFTQTIKKLIDGTKFSFKEAMAPRISKPSRRLQDLIGETCSGGPHQLPTDITVSRLITRA